MSIKEVIKRYQNEADAIHEKMDVLKNRLQIVEMMLKELRGAGKVKVGRKPMKKKAVRKGRKKSGMTVRDAIMKTVTAAKNPLPAKDIIKGAVEFSGGAIASIRTQINSLAKGGLIKQVPYEGRGFRYSAGGAAKAPKKVTKKPAAKPAEKKPAAKPAEKKEQPKSEE